MDADEIRDLPASWYAAQPIPRRLALALLDWPSPNRIARSAVPVAVLRAIHGTAKRSPVEQAHVRATNRLGRPK